MILVEDASEHTTQKRPGPTDLPGWHLMTFLELCINMDGRGLGALVAAIIKGDVAKGFEEQQRFMRVLADALTVAAPLFRVSPASNVRDIRQRREMTQRELAERSGITPAAISQLETGKMYMSPEMAEQLSAILEVEARQLRIEHLVAIYRARIDAGKFTVANLLGPCGVQVALHKVACEPDKSDLTPAQAWLLDQTWWELEALCGLQVQECLLAKAREEVIQRLSLTSALSAVEGNIWFALAIFSRDQGEDQGVALLRSRARTLMSQRDKDA